MIRTKNKVVFFKQVQFMHLRSFRKRAHTFTELHAFTEWLSKASVTSQWLHQKNNENKVTKMKSLEKIRYLQAVTSAGIFNKREFYENLFLLIFFEGLQRHREINLMFYQANWPIKSDTYEPTRPSRIIWVLADLVPYTAIFWPTGPIKNVNGE